MNRDGGVLQLLKQVALQLVVHRLRGRHDRLGRRDLADDLTAEPREIGQHRHGPGGCGLGLCEEQRDVLEAAVALKHGRQAAVGPLDRVIARLARELKADERGDAAEVVVPAHSLPIRSLLYEGRLGQAEQPGAPGEATEAADAVLAPLGGAATVPEGRRHLHTGHPELVQRRLRRRCALLQAGAVTRGCVLLRAPWRLLHCDAQAEALGCGGGQDLGELLAVCTCIDAVAPVPSCADLEGSSRANKVLEVDHARGAEVNESGSPLDRQRVIQALNRCVGDPQSAVLPLALLQLVGWKRLLDNSARETGSGAHAGSSAAGLTRVAGKLTVFECPCTASPAERSPGTPRTMTMPTLEDGLCELSISLRFSVRTVSWSTTAVSVSNA